MIPAPDRLTIVDDLTMIERMLSVVLLPLLAFVAAAGVLTITPGIDTAMVLRTSASGGPRAGIAAGLGICGGLFVWGTGAAFGLTAVLAASEIAFTVVKWLGAAYLVYLGAKLLAKPRTTLNTAPASGQGPRNSGATSALKRGFLTNVLNPKVGVFYATFLPQFIPHGVNIAAFSLLLAGIHVLLTLAWFLPLVALTIPLGQFLAKQRVVKALDRLTGCVFVAFGVKLAVARRA
jgi:threonine/homoserine/homoserine lactone efflux protein